MRDASLQDAVVPFHDPHYFDTFTSASLAKDRHMHDSSSSASRTGFECLRIWHVSRKLTKRIYEITRADAFARDLGLKGQIQRAAISIMSNIAEGYERGGQKELLQFLRIAKGSAAEVRSQLYTAQDLGYLDEVTAEALRGDAIRLTRQITAFAASVQVPKR
jgi:four helix bundle protein